MAKEVAMLKYLPNGWIQHFTSISSDDVLLFKIGRFAVFQPINETIIILLDKTLNITYCFDTRVLETREDYNKVIHCLKLCLKKYYQKQNGKQLSLFSN